ncbi:MAG TPA: HD-GYP domain-containing protein [Actinomycetes bacterium]|nr:HD-GYP domain-containing protein [Actinomycetes bacterium]
MEQLRPAAKVYLTVVTVGAIVALAASVAAIVDDREHVRVLVVLAPIFVLSVYLKSRMTQQVSLSANVPILIAAYLIGGWAVACLVGVSSIVLDRRRAPSRMLFNNAQWVLMGLAGGLVYEAMGGSSMQHLTDSGFSPALLGPIIVSIAAVIAVNAALMLGILAFQENIGPATIWRSMVLTSVGPYFAYGLLGLLMAVLWSIGGGFAAALVLLPLLVARWAFNQYAVQREAYESTIRALVQAVETKDHYTRGHSERVSRASVMIARLLGMRDDRVEALRYAGILHDVGKLGVPTRVLQKTGPLSDMEFDAIKRHPRNGTEMVRGIAFLEEAYNGIMHHHERLDGRGYPLGLAGKDIPEFARIIAVADAFDSMTSTRSYRGARDVPAALAELQKCAGTQFDGVMVDALVSALEQEPWSVVPPPEERVMDVEVGIPTFDHDDPTANLPGDVDPAIAAEAAAAEALNEELIHRRDLLRRGGWS